MDPGGHKEGGPRGGQEGGRPRNQWAQCYLHLSDNCCCHCFCFAAVLVFFGCCHKFFWLLSLVFAAPGLRAKGPKAHGPGTQRPREGPGRPSECPGKPRGEPREGGPRGLPELGKD